MQDVSHDETTLRIIESAKKDFLQNGYQGASLRVICHCAGITTGAFYHRFSGKSELYEAVVVPDSMKFLEMLNTSPIGDEQSVIPKPCLVFIYLHLDVFKIVVRCKCTSYYDKFYDVVRKSIYQRLLKSNHAENLCWLLSKAYLSSFFEIIRCNYDFRTARKCIGTLEKFFAPTKN